MPQLGHLLKYVLGGTAFGAVANASCTVYREGATVSGGQSGTSPLVVTVRHRGKIAVGDTVFVGTVTGTTYNVNAATATTLTLGGFFGTLNLNDSDRIVPSNSTPTLYSDDQGGATTSNPLTSSSTGKVEAYLEFGGYDLLFSGTGITSRLEQYQVMPTEAPGQVRYADAFNYSGSTTGGIQEALNDLGSIGGKVILSAGVTYNMTTEVLHNVATNNSVVIEGGGWHTVVSLIGVANKGFHITGTQGVTTPGCILRNFRIASATSGISPAAIHLDGLAVIALENMMILGNSLMTNGIQLTATQQGEISGGYIKGCTVGLLMENTASAACNGIEVHGVSFASCTTSIKLDATLRVGELDIMIHNNHFVTSTTGIDAINGFPTIVNNHLELQTTAIKMSKAGAGTGSTAFIAFNGFGNAAASKDIDIVDGYAVTMLANQFNSIVNLQAGLTNGILAFNRFVAGSTLTNNSVALTKIANEDPAGAGALASTLRSTVDIKRIFATLGTSHVNGDWALGASWGVGATAVVAAASKDNRFRVTITAAGVPGGSPTATLTFKDGTFTTTPFAVVALSGGTGVLTTPPTWNINPTTLVISYPGTPVAGNTYIYEGILLG